MIGERLFHIERQKRVSKKRGFAWIDLKQVVFARTDERLEEKVTTEEIYRS
jgi:hypothetical protein